MGSTTVTPELETQMDALVSGRGYAVPPGLRLLLVRGADARRWLGDLITADVAGMDVGASRRSLILTPTGRIRVDVQAIATEDGFVLAQDADQEEWVGDVLAPYVLSSAVELVEVTDERAVVLLEPGRFVSVEADRLAAMEGAFADEGRTRVGADALEVLRVRRGAPRIGVDVVVGALPAGSRLDETIDTTKGCFLGQEAVAKVRNLGHPPTASLHLRAAGVLVAGDTVHTPGDVAGVVTSAVPAHGGGSVLLARVDWDAVQGELSTADGTPLEPIAD